MTEIRILLVAAKLGVRGLDECEEEGLGMGIPSPC